MRRHWAALKLVGEIWGGGNLVEIFFEGGW